MFANKEIDALAFNGNLKVFWDSMMPLSSCDHLGGHGTSH